MLTKNIRFKNFSNKSNISKVTKEFKKLIKSNSEIINSLSSHYSYSFSKNIIKKYKNFFKLRVIGMGGSILGTEAIFNFLRHKIKKNFLFINNINNNSMNKKESKILNIIVSKSGNTLETISNSNILINKNDKNIFITENKNSYLNNLAKKLKSEIIHHNNFIGGRYSVLSEVGMLPAELMGLNSKKFKLFDNLIKNRLFVNNLVSNVAAILNFVNEKKFNSIIINYDKNSESLFNWYQQLVAESLGKKNNGLLPIVSNMPKDNHSVMQLYLDGFKNNFFTFFYVKEKNSPRINNQEIFLKRNYLKNKNIDQIINSQKTLCMLEVAH